jgi:hypothetical protein
MAIQHTIIKSAFGQVLEVPDVYCKISRVAGDKEGVTINVEFWSDNGLLFTEAYSFKPSVDDGAENFIKQGYEHLKTLDSFYGCIDV